ncbi:MAG: RsmG family class I SAM-dependent methyltransferase [Thermoleophilia bacterium]
MSDDPRLAAWLAALATEPGLTSIDDPDEIRRVHLDDALVAAELVREGPVVDVGSGGGSPGLPLAAAHPELEVVLLEATERKCAFLRVHAAGFPNVRVLNARAEDAAGGEGRDAYATAVSRALASPPVAVEWCLPLVRPGGALILYTSLRAADAIALAAAEVAGELAELRPVAGSEHKALAVVRKIGPTPGRFPRRPGVARKRPLA